ncbi:uncharacterized protein LOC113369631 [Ctenocephalides felis]|uniref:uncharacterized protein LOC113369631 n=1 Tax=Ctenocephalides felis TaxID=7515 RepID=UPI000E6E2419|nr:uncharacterized protein LOC113369631 [Ctenocephalides felis]
MPFKEYDADILVFGYPLNMNSTEINVKYKKINLIAIAGGSASGKTTVAEKIAEACNKKNVIFVQMDNYYHDLSNLKVEERKKTNFDHPNAIDMKLLIYDLEQLLLGNAIEEPIYDFKINSRSKNTEIIGPGDVIILDGIFALENPIIRELSTIKILLILILEVDGNKFNTEETVLNEIIRLNEEITSEHVEIKNFITASEIKNGSAELHAKTDSKYTGQVNITITAKDKIALDSKITNKEVNDNKFNTEKAVLDEIIKQNKDVTANDVEIKKFKAASERTAGSAELHAKADSKYTGKVNIIITKVDTEEERLVKIIKKIKVANDKERYGLVEQRINIYFTNENMLIDNENKTLKFDNL